MLKFGYQNRILLEKQRGELSYMSLQNQSKKALVVVAHCDDAVLWMGGVIHRLRDWKWHILSMCNENNNEKIRSFDKSCEMLGVERSQPLNFRDYQTGKAFSQNSRERMKFKLTTLIDEPYDYVFSHSLQKWNEYSHHANHEEVGIIASDIAKEKSSPLIRFCYDPIYGGGIATVADRERAQYFFQLNYRELKFKVNLLIDCFPQEKGNLENLAYPCPNPEAFEVHNILPVPPFIRKR